VYKRQIKGREISIDEYIIAFNKQTNQNIPLNHPNPIEFMLNYLASTGNNTASDGNNTASTGNNTAATGNTAAAGNNTAAVGYNDNLAW
jgi:hypothetical protein